MADRLTIAMGAGRVDVDNEAIKFYDGQGRLVWYFNGDGLVRIPGDSPVHRDADFRKAVVYGTPISFVFGEGHQ